MKGLVLGVMDAEHEMNANYDDLFDFLNQNTKYKQLFAKAFPEKSINKETLSIAIAQFERTITSNNTPFDRWLTGDKSAMTQDQVAGFQLFVNKNKGNCISCHHPPNFTDNGFHNIGLRSFGESSADMGRFIVKPIKVLKGAFKTPSLRGVGLTAPYFHDGSAANLTEVIEHYSQGGQVTSNLAPELKKLSLSNTEKQQLEQFLQALTYSVGTYPVPILP